MHLPSMFLLLIPWYADIIPGSLQILGNSHVMSPEWISPGRPLFCILIKCFCTRKRHLLFAGEYGRGAKEFAVCEGVVKATLPMKFQKKSGRSISSGFLFFVSHTFS